MSRARNVLDPSPDAPVVNPYERFTQLDFDDYVGGLRNKIQDALDPRRGLRHRDRDSDASFGLGRGEFRMGRSISVGESSFAASGQSVPRWSVEDGRGERRNQYNHDEDDPESDTSEQEDKSRLAPKPTTVVSGEGDSESPFVISDDEDEEPGPTAGEALTPRSKAHQLLGLQGADEEDEGDYDDEGDDEKDDDEEEDRPTISPLRAPPESGPLNLYDDIDDIELVEDDGIEEIAAGDPLENPFDESFEGSQSPAWPDHVSADGDAHGENHLQESGNNLDEYFSADMDHLPPGFSSGFGYDASQPEMREYSRHAENPFSQMLGSGLAAGPSFSNEGLPQMFPTHESDAIVWPNDEFLSGSVGSMPEFPSTNIIFTEGISQSSTLREESQGISYPSLPVLSEGGNVNIFDPFTYPPHNPVETTFTPVPSQLYESGDVTPTVHENSIPVVGPHGTVTEYDEESLPGQEFTHPDTIEEPRDSVVPHYSEDIGSAITPSLTPPLSPSGITLTAPDPSLLSDNSSIATSVPVALEPAGHVGRQIDSVEFEDGLEDLTLPEEVTQELNQDASLLPDPHRVPEPTSLGTPVGVAGLATRIIEPSVWAEPPTPSRSDYADDGVNNPEINDSTDSSEDATPPQQDEPVAESQPMNSRNFARVRWRDHYTTAASPSGTSRHELELPEPAAVQPTPLEHPAETPHDEISSLEHSLTLPTPIQTPSETPHEQDKRLPVPSTAIEVPPETPREALNTLEQILLNGGSTGGTPLTTPLTMRGNLTRESTMTDATWSQGPAEASPLRHATSATLTGESYFPSQPIPSPSRQTLSEQGETQNTLDEPEASAMKRTPDVDHSVAHSNSPFSGDSPLSEDEQEPSVSKPIKARKRGSNLSRLSSSVGAVGKRELKALQDSSLQLDSGRPRRKPSNKPTVQTNKATSRAKGKQKASPVTRKEPPKAGTSTRLRALRSNSLVSPTVSKQSSPTSTAGHEESNESSRDELDLLEEADEEERERGQEDAGSRRGGENPKKKRKRHPKVSMLGEDEDYLPEDAERSLKKRKLEAKEHNLDESLDTIDLASVLAMAEEKPPAAVQTVKKPKSKKKKSQTLPEEPLEAESPSGESSDRGSEFKPSPDAEEAPQELTEGVEIDAETFRRLSPAAQAKFRRLNPDSRAYKPSGESDSESDDNVEVSRRDLVADLRGVVEGLDEPAELSKREGGSESAMRLELEGEANVPKQKEKRKKSGGTKKSKKTDPATAVSPSVGEDRMILAPEKPGGLPTEEEQSRDNDVEMELEGDADVVTSIDQKGPASGTQQPPPQGTASERSAWMGYFPFKNPFRSSNEQVVSTTVGNVSPVTDPMEID